MDDEELDALAGELLKVRPKKEKGAILAANDALHIKRVYAKRRELGEASRGNPYGYRTWWLTQATSALAATKDLVKRKGAAYMMLPEFLLNFISLNPSMEEVQRNFEKVFPSLLGVKLSNRMRDEVFTLVVDRVRQVGALGEGRARALLAELSDKLKGDNYLAYEAELWKNAKATKRGSVSKDAPRSSQ